MSEITKAYEKLQEYVAQNELERRKWAGEIWTHTTGRIYKTARILLPLLSVISVFLCVIYAFIRDAQTLLKNTGGLSYEAQDSTAHFYIVAVFGVIVVVANAFIFTKIRRIGEIVNTAISLLMGIYLFSQSNIPMPNENNKYKVLMGITITILILSAAATALMIIIEMMDKKAEKQSFEHILSVITAQKSGIVDESEYPILIDEYLKKQAEKTHAQKVKAFRKA